MRNKEVCYRGSVIECFSFNSHAIISFSAAETNVNNNFVDKSFLNPLNFG